MAADIYLLYSIRFALDNWQIWSDEEQQKAN